MEERKAVVLAGGGSRGAYQIGVWKALRELDYRYTIVTGTSVGALNGAMMTVGDWEQSEQIWSQISTEKILDYTPEGDISSARVQKKALKAFLHRVIKERSIDQTPLKGLLSQVIDVNKIYDSPVDFGLVTLTYPKLQPVQLFKEQIPKEHFIDYLMASSAFFPAMRAYPIENQKFIDGGYYDSMPVQMAIDHGATQVVAVNLNALGIHREVKNPEVPVITVEPREDLGFVLFFHEDFARANMRRGYWDTMKAFGKYAGWLYTFDPDSFGRQEEAFAAFCHITAEKVLPSTKGGELRYRHLAGILTRKMVRETSAQTVANSLLIPAAEIAGKVLGISPLEWYRKDRFDQEVGKQLEEAEGMELPAETEFRKLLETVKDEKKLARFLLHELLALSGESAGGKTLLLFAAEFAPRALLTAVYAAFGSTFCVEPPRLETENAGLPLEEG